MNSEFTHESTNTLQNSDEGKITLAPSVAPVISYSMQYNGISLVKDVEIKNDTDLPLEDCVLEISSNPEITLPYTAKVEYVPPKKVFRIKTDDLILDAEYLARITEAIDGQLILKLKKGEDVVFELKRPITLLSRNQWSGCRYYPEFLASFVTPCHPSLAGIIARAKEILAEWTKSSSIDGYESQDPNKVLTEAAAIFTAVKELEIECEEEVCNYESVGQHIRLCTDILSEKKASALDMALLYASLLESINLRPILILIPDHIISGVWLDKLAFPEAVTDDPSVVTKRLAEGVNEIAVVEMIAAAKGSGATFDEAREIVSAYLTTGEEINFALDIFRARVANIIPLTTLSDTEYIPTAFTKGRTTELAPKKLAETDLELEKKEEGIPKIVQWERKLLDLGMRNNLINLRMSKTLIPIITSSLDDLEDALWDGSDFTILPRPVEWNMNDADFTFDTNHSFGQLSDLIKEDFSSKRLHSSLKTGDLNAAVKALFRSAKTSMEENGANTLYLALGLLKWFETEKSAKPRYAPLVLVPVELVRKPANAGYLIRLRDDDAQMNVTILEKINQDFKISIEGLDPLPQDEHGIDLRKVYTVIRRAVMDMPHWDVLESAYLGIFSFSQFVMWNDLRHRTDDLLKSRTVKSLIEGRLTWDAKPMEIGEKVDESGVLLPLPADASQLFAIKSACQGESFVLHGPPGTGKSQTITSLIANALDNGKSVLFVAEKMAALEVVQKRLENIGIGAFCLELHSNKSKKRTYSSSSDGQRR